MLQEYNVNYNTFNSLSHKATLTPEEESQLQTATTNLITMETHTANGHAVRARLNREIDCDKPSKYFLSQEKNKYQSNHIHSLQNDQGTDSQDPLHMLETTAKYYKQLYTSKPADQAAQEEILRATLNHPNNLKDNQNELLSNPFTEQEVFKALTEAPCNDIESLE